MDKGTKERIKELKKQKQYDDRKMYNEIKQERGTIAAIIWKIKQKTMEYAKIIGINRTLMLTAGDTVISSEVKQMGLSDIQIFMKVMDDNKASDVAKKLNEINPKYNARTMLATMGEDGRYEITDIERTILEKNQTVEENNMVTLVDVPSDNLIIVLNSTNPGIGIYINGKIIIVNSTMKEEQEKYTEKELTEAIMAKGGFDSLADITLDYIKSFRNPRLTQEEIEKKYGLDAQNKALKEVRAREKVEEIFAEQEKGKQNKLRNEIKIELPKIELPQLEI